MDIEELKKIINELSKEFGKFSAAINELKIEITANKESHKYTKARMQVVENSIEKIDDKIDKKFSELSIKFSGDIKDVHQKIEKFFLQFLNETEMPPINSQIVNTSEQKTLGSIIFQPTTLFFGSVTLLNVLISNIKAIKDFIHKIFGG